MSVGGLAGRAAAAALFFFCAAAPCAAAPPLAERAKACFVCHGENGTSTRPDTPSLGGQPAFFLITQLFLLREGRRGLSEMVAAAKGMSDDDMRGFAELMSKLPPPAPQAGRPDPQKMARAAQLLRENHCHVCHNQDFSGREQMARLAGQREDYLLRAMREFRSGKRLGYGQAMTSELATLTDADCVALAHFFAHLPPAAAGR